MAKNVTEAERQAREVRKAQRHQDSRLRMRLLAQRTQEHWEKNKDSIILASKLAVQFKKTRRMRRHRQQEMHGKGKDPLYGIWRGMMSRCYSGADVNYFRYGHRGIEVCPRWHSFAAFFEDMHPRPSKDLSLDRIDNDGPYSPDNCRWATWAQQANNKMTTLFVEFAGERLTLADWSAKTGIKETVLRSRYARGLSETDMFS